MLSGIGVLLILSQFHVMVDDTPKGEAWKKPDFHYPKRYTRDSSMPRARVTIWPP